MNEWLFGLRRMANRHQNNNNNNNNNTLIRRESGFDLFLGGDKQTNI